MNDDERLRPRWHFTTRREWMNDPNGLVFFEGEYHLFFQTNPAGSGWGNISWGHAVSGDLVEWQVLAPALRPYPARVPGADTLIFSGSAVADRDRGGRQTGRMRAYFTAHERAGDTPLNESVGLAWSDDAGRSWQYDERNPVLDLQRTDFRDPKVFWFDGDDVWVMVIAEPKAQSVDIYRSLDGIDWQLASVFHRGCNDEQLWECPDLFEVAVRGTEERRWVLVVSGVHQAGAPFTGMQYWVGDFDGSTFVADRFDATPLEYGKDFFAGVTFNDLDRDADPVMIAWASNWAYAGSTPTPGWRGAMAMPRRLWLERDGEQMVLCQSPVQGLDATVPVADRLPVVRHAAAVIDLTVGSAGVGVELRSGDDEQVTVRVEPGPGRMSIDRRRSGDVDFHPDFASCDEAPLPGDSVAGLDVRIVVDHSLVEVFAANGRVAMTSLVYPSGPWTIDVTGDAEDVAVRFLD